MAADVHKKYLGNLDIIRIIAATGIVFHHYQQISAVKFGGGIEFYGGRFTFGYLVELFFIMSGFLTEYTFNTGSSFKSWMIGKMKRYYPFSFFACVVCLITALIFSYLTDLPMFGLKYDAPTIITSLTLFHQGWIVEFSPAINNPSWYLCILTLCYLIFWGTKKINFSRKWVLFLTISVLMVPAHYGVTHGISNIPFIRLTNIRGYGSFFIGCTLCEIWRYSSKKTMLLADLGLCLFSGIGFAVLGLSNWYVLTYLFFPTIVITALLLPQIKNRIIQLAGAVSFEVYLWHVPLYGIIQVLSLVCNISVQHTYFTMVLFSVLAWGIGLLIYRTIELPTSEKIRELTQKQ